VHSERQDAGLGCPTWTVDGTPCDSVNIGIGRLLPVRPDAVLSGINIGLNASLGFILGSGTVAGACEGALHGLPGIAMSQSLPIGVYDDLKEKGGQPDPALLEVLRASAAHAARLAPALAAQTPANAFIVHNLNFPHPCLPETQVRRAAPARIPAHCQFSPRAKDGTHHFVYGIWDDISPEAPLTDRAALDAGFISHSVLDFSKLGSI
jgi:5'-nucleotidase